MTTDSTFRAGAFVGALGCLLVFHALWLIRGSLHSGLVGLWVMVLVYGASVGLVLLRSTRGGEADVE